MKALKYFKDSKLIYLCNVVYKIVSRAITNKFRPILENVIDDYQSGFIPGCLITDNVLVGFECMHWLRHIKRGNMRYVAIKLDMSKAYNRVEWRFLQRIMTRLGFSTKKEKKNRLD